ncbi:coiled-coil domain-containing protein-domain-containing protein [Lipomyces arxii]|uniref:coiled-coil domain-containing protein-domain-containing protein n=1 Tax=Lipomyces arxii TaxID=56418 RepID=UPI0034CD4327
MSNLPPKSFPPPERHHLTIKNRRLHYLQKNTPSYFDNSGHAEADPLLYDRLIRRFQHSDERQSESDKRGWAARMYEDLMRAEQRLEKEEDRLAEEARRREAGEDVDPEEVRTQVDCTDEPTTREGGEDQWRYILTIRFLEGLDVDFDYDEVDYNEQWDDLDQIGRDFEDKYFDEEDPHWANGDNFEDDNVAADRGKALEGQTGIQDF